MKKGIWLALFFVEMGIKVLAQMQNPPGLQWQSMESGNFQVIFPAEMKNKASQALTNLNTNYNPVSATLQIEPKPIRLFLFSQSAEANGYFTLAPRYMAWYVNPIADNSMFGGGDWLQLLSAHEFRHVAQFDKVNDGFTNLGHILFGEYGWAILSNLSVPHWFWEGDAVDTETKLTPIGRGNVPGFQMEIRTSLLSGQKLSYDQAYLQSFRKYYPSHYHLGYQLVTHVSEVNGPGSWPIILQNSSHHSYSPYGFTRSVKRATGVNIRKTFKNMNASLKEKWMQERIVLPDSNLVQVITSFKKGVQTNYKYPCWIDSSHLVALKSGYDDAQQLVLIATSGKETKLCHLYSESGITAAVGKVVWATSVQDLRWGERSYSCLEMYDLASRSKRWLTHQTRFYAPSLSPDGKRIAVVENTSSMHCNLVILDAATGNILSTIPSPGDGYIRMPSWDAEGRSVVFIHSNRQGMAIMLFDTQTNRFSTLLSHRNVNISHPQVSDGVLFYSAAQKSIDVVYAQRISTGGTYIAYGNRYGNYYPTLSPNGKKIAWSAYSPFGFNLCISPVDSSAWIYQRVIDNQPDMEIAKLALDSISSYAVSDYHPSLNLFKFHSWAIFPTNALNLRAYSNDYLNTSATTLGMNMYSNQKGFDFLCNYTYSGWFPVLSVQAMKGIQTESVSDTTNYYNETSLAAGIGFPLNFSKGNITTTLQLQNNIVYSNIDGMINSFSKLANINNGKTIYSLSQVDFGYHVANAPRDLGPGSGVSLTAKYVQSLPNSTYSGKLLSSVAQFSLGSFLRHHNATITCGYENRFEAFNPLSYPFGTSLLYPRGYAYNNYLKEKVCASFDYELPLFYPDLSLSGLCFIKRVRLNGFYDYAKATGISSENYSSAGIEIKADVNVFRFLTPIDMGLRISRLQADGTFVYEFLFLGIAL